MAKKSMILKQQAEPKFSSRKYNRCKICGRPHAYLRNYGKDAAAILFFVNKEKNQKKNFSQRNSAPLLVCCQEASGKSPVSSSF